MKVNTANLQRFLESDYSNKHLTGKMRAVLHMRFRAEYPRSVGEITVKLEETQGEIQQLVRKGLRQYRAFLQIEQDSNAQWEKMRTTAPRALKLEDIKWFSETMLTHLQTNEVKTLEDLLLLHGSPEYKWVRYFAPRLAKRIDELVERFKEIQLYQSSSR